MASPISPETRHKIVDAYDNGEGTYQAIADRFEVGVASVSRFLQLHRHSNDLSARPKGGSRPKILEEQEELLCTMVVDEPKWTTQELADELDEAYSIAVSRFTVGRTLKRLGFWFKRGSSDRQLLSAQTSSRRGASTFATKPRWIRTD
jgi:transposase